MDGVTVWAVRTDQARPVGAVLRRHLDDEERRRADAMPDPVRRGQFVVAHAALREIVGARLGLAAAAVRWERGPNGKPEPAGGALRISLSTCGRLALVALTRTRPVGVDVERLPAERVAVRLAARHFAESEAGYVTAVPARSAARFTTLWTRKEACVKALGGRLSEGMRRGVQGRPPLTVAWAGSSPRTLRLDDLPAPRAHRAAVALAGAEPFHVRYRVWQPGLSEESLADV